MASLISLAVVLMSAAILWHERRQWRARLDLLEHKFALPELRREADSWTERVYSGSREATPDDPSARPAGLPHGA